MILDWQQFYYSPLADQAESYQAVTRHYHQQFHANMPNWGDVSMTT